MKKQQNIVPVKDQLFLSSPLFRIFKKSIPMNLIVGIQKRIIEHQIRKLKNELNTLED